ncbi:hypothetical protein EXU48_19315 [Occultella glacieicola]|uniref:Uncharacterized protein n=1 Tax=Occultella glacieicola TaxID=2518684 RepID=A0ABY2DZE5_9MICO|nr:hypothetical protein [Occultella glacieicola]TDE90066.1 hypothetical protein EXU48_19315 [Occultella glacieicola]
MGDRDHLKFSKAFDTFLRKHVSEENSTFRLERVLTDEVMVIETSLGIIGRVRNGDSPEATYRRYERRTDGAELQLRFAFRGYEALDAHGPWVSDRETLLPDDSFENLELAWARELDRREQRRREIAAMPKLDKKALNQFCRAWADTGYNEYVSDSEVYYVLFDGRTLDEAGAARDELLTAIETLGLALVEPQAGAPAGEVWVRSDPRVDLELEKWA